MATTSTQVPPQHSSYDPGYGWVLFGGILLMLLGTIDLIEGLAAVAGSHFFVRNPSFIAGNLTEWGWVVTFIGTCEFVAGFMVLTKNQLARWFGVGLVSLHAVVQLLMLPADPFWSISVIALDIVALYALVVHGRQISDTARSEPL